MPTDPMHTIEIPPGEPGANRSWRKLLTALDDTERGGFAVQGPWLDGGAQYKLPVGALIVAVDHTSETEHRIRLLRVNARGRLTTERDSTFKRDRSSFGTGMRHTLARALAAHPPAAPDREPHLVQSPEPTNHYDGRCAACGHPVPANTGRLDGAPGDRHHVRHKPGDCPPAPPAEPRRNLHAQTCADCGGLIEAGAGILTSPYEGVWEVRHDGPCPPPEKKTAPPPPPRRANMLPDQCVRCGQEVPEGEGLLIDPAYRGALYTVEHNGPCPPSPADGHRTWRVIAGVPGPFNPRPGRYWQNGDIDRFTVHPRTDEGPVPRRAPGRRPGRHRSGISLIGVIVAEDPPYYNRDADGEDPSEELIGEDGWVFTGRIRAATAEEAALLLAEEAEAEIDATLSARVNRLLAWRYPDPDSGVRYLSEEELARELEDLHLVGLRTRPAPGSNFGYDGHPDLAWIADDWPWVMTTTYNGRDGDNWSLTNWRDDVALLHPMTDELRQLVTDLTARYGPGRPA
ncbi:hypothetical protein [Kitasatospora sp. NPDC088548]|uniref:hypothetical protein n=1 Tax=Kitasatospora sp. NPDC088548 TaxID=3364075 RepID=UPI00381DCFFD